MPLPASQNAASTEERLPDCSFCLNVLLRKWTRSWVISRFVDNPDVPGLGSKNDIYIYPLKDKAHEVPS